MVCFPLLTLSISSRSYPAALSPSFRKHITCTPFCSGFARCVSILSRCSNIFNFVCRFTVIQLLSWGVLLFLRHSVLRSLAYRLVRACSWILMCAHVSCYRQAGGRTVEVVSVYNRAIFQAVEEQSVVPEPATGNVAYCQRAAHPSPSSWTSEHRAARGFSAGNNMSII